MQTKIFDTNFVYMFLPEISCYMLCAKKLYADLYVIRFVCFFSADNFITSHNIYLSIIVKQISINSTFKQHKLSKQSSIGHRSIAHISGKEKFKLLSRFELQMNFWVFLSFMFLQRWIKWLCTSCLRSEILCWSADFEVFNLVIPFIQKYSKTLIMSPPFEQMKIGLHRGAVSWSWYIEQNLGVPFDPALELLTPQIFKRRQFAPRILAYGSYFSNTRYFSAENK